MQTVNDATDHAPGADDRRIRFPEPFPATGVPVRLPAARAAAQDGKRKTMLKWALIFLLVAIVAGALGFTNVAAGAATIARVLFGLFLILFLIALIMTLLGVSLFA